MSGHEHGEADEDPMTVELRIPVFVRMKGYARVRVPIDASRETIDEKLEEISEVSQLEKFEQDDERNGESAWKESPSKHLYLLAVIGAAFRALDAQNIAPVANQCCNSDSDSQGYEILRGESRYIGFAFIHGQNIDDLMERGKFHIGYAARENKPEAHLKIGRMVKAALEAQKFVVNWNENPDTKLEITDFQGERPRRGGLAGRLRLDT